jgi:hypothetical protein
LDFDAKMLKNCNLAKQLKNSLIKLLNLKMAEDISPQIFAIPLKTAEVWTKNHRDNLELDGSERIDTIHANT